MRGRAEKLSAERRSAKSRAVKRGKIGRNFDGNMDSNLRIGSSGLLTGPETRASDYRSRRRLADVFAGVDSRSWFGIDR